MKALNMRFEPPESKNRWDSPLFKIGPTDELPLEEISHILLNTRAAPPNKSTLNVNYLLFFFS
jgi:tRNA uridine 5-carbamoylmethylation protein Kti12